MKVWRFFVDTGKNGCIIFPVALEGAPSRKRERLIKQDTSGDYKNSEQIDRVRFQMRCKFLSSDYSQSFKSHSFYRLGHQPLVETK